MKRPSKRKGRIYAGLGLAILVTILGTTLYWNVQLLMATSRGRHAADPLATNMQDDQDLLHFAIIGFGKCGTTSILQYLAQHPQVAVWPVENFDLQQGRPEALLDKMRQLRRQHYHHNGNNTRTSTLLLGYKSPVDVALPHVLEYLATHFPRTKLIVGVRHPLAWFQSLYHFRSNNARHHRPFPSPDALIGPCVASALNTCTYKGEFALFLRQLGKTFPTVVGTKHVNATPTEFERRMYQVYHMDGDKNNSSATPLVVPNPVFLYEMNQLQDPGLVPALHDFLGLPSTPNAPPRFVPHANARRDNNHSTDISIICQHAKVRKELMRMARSASVWIRFYFLKQQRRERSSITTFGNISDWIQTWMKDPCPNHPEQTQSAGRYILQAFRDEQHAEKLRRQKLNKKN